MTEPVDADRALSRASLRALWRPVGVSAALSLATGFAESLSYAGLASYLAAGVLGESASILGVRWFSRPLTILVLTAVTFVCNIVNTFVRERAVAAWDLERRRDLLGAFQAADYPAQVGESGAALTVTMEQCGRASNVIGSLIALINGVIATLIMIGLAFATSWQVSVVAIVTGGTLMVGMRRLSRRTRVMARQTGAEAVVVGEYVGDTVASVRELHLLDRWGDVDRWLDQRLDRIYHLTVRNRFLAGMVGPIFSLGTIGVGLLVGFVATRGDSPSASSLAASGILLIRSLSFAQSTQVSYQAFHDGLPFMDRVLGTIERLRSLARPRGDGWLGGAFVVDVSGVQTSYGNDTVLHDIDLSFSGPGGVAIVGPSGGGKSTLLLTLSGLVPPDTGTVSIGGSDIRDLERSAVGATVGYLAQDPRLVREPLRDNLARPDVEVDDEDLHRVLAQVGLDTTVAGFAAGLDTPMGRGGEGFSGGELQRLGLARLLVNRPPIWLLDEPTSALDRVNSDRVAALVAAAVETHLVVIVTHRPDLLAHCGHLVYVEDGRVVDQGDPAAVGGRHPFVRAMLDGLSDGTGTGGEGGEDEDRDAGEAGG